MSTIREELVEVTGLKPKRGEDDSDFRLRLAFEVGEISDEDWSSLSKAARDWYQDNTDAYNRDKTVLPFPDEGGVEDEVKQDDAVGTRVVVETTRGLAVEGVIEEVGADFLTIKDDEGELQDFTRSRIKSVTPVATESKSDPVDSDPEPGDTVFIRTKRGTELTGEVVSIDDDEVSVTKEDGETVFYTRSRLEVLEVVKKGGEKEEPAATTRMPEVGDELLGVTKRGSKVSGKVVELDDSVIVIESSNGREYELDIDGEWDFTSAPAVEEPVSKPARGKIKTEGTVKTSTGSEKKKVTKKENGGVSVTEVMMDIVCENPKITIEGVAKQLEKRGLDFNENTLKINFATTNKVISKLKANGHFK